MLNPFESLPVLETGVSRSGRLSRHRCVMTSIGHSKPTDPEVYRFDNNVRGGGCLFQYTLAGAGRFRNGQTGVTTVLEPGLGFLLPFPSNTYYWLEPGTEWEFVYTCMAGDALRYHVGELNRQYGFLYKIGPTQAPVQILRELFTAVLADRAPSEFIISSQLYRLLMDLYALQQPAREALPADIEQAKRYVDEEYHVIDIGVDAMAAVAGCSKYHFSRRFKTHVGVSPYEYLLQVRLRRAQELLVSTDLPGKEIGMMVGFGDYAYFCNSFRRRLGLTPGALRRQSRRFGTSRLVRS